MKNLFYTCSPEKLSPWLKNCVFRLLLNCFTCKIMAKNMNFTSTFSLPKADYYYWNSELSWQTLIRKLMIGDGWAWFIV